MIEPESKRVDFMAGAVGVVISILGYFYHDRFFKWVDESLVRYWVVAGGGFGILILAVFSAEAARSGFGFFRSRVSFALLLALTLVAFRWPSVVHNHQLSDPDESQLLAGAITLTHDPVFFRSVDGTTHGPLDQYVFTSPYFFGVPIDFLTGRSVLLLLNWVALVACWLALGTFLPERMARAGVLPPLAFYALATADSILQCGTEDLPATLIMLGLCFLCFAGRAIRQGRARPWIFLAAGLCVGAVPLAKLQGVLPATALGVGGIAAILGSSAQRRAKGANLVALMSGAVVPTLFCVAMVVSTGVFSDFWEAYIVHNFGYAQQKHHSPAWMLLHFFSYASETHEVWFFKTNVYAIAVGMLGLVKMPRDWATPVTLIAGCALFAFVAVLVPGRAYAHYLRLLIVPLSALAAATSGVWITFFVRRFSARQGWAGIAAFTALMLIPQFHERDQHTTEFRYGFYRTERKLQPSAVAQLIRQHARPTDSLAMWGWEPRIYVETQLRQATREAHTVHQVEPSAQQNYYQCRFLSDLVAARPAVFVDAVGLGNFIMQDRTVLGHETFAELARVIARDYRLLCDKDGFRVYVRVERPLRGSPKGSGRFMLHRADATRLDLPPAF